MGNIPQHAPDYTADERYKVLVSGPNGTFESNLDPVNLFQSACRACGLVDKSRGTGYDGMLFLAAEENGTLVVNVPVGQ